MISRTLVSVVLLGVMLFAAYYAADLIDSSHLATDDDFHVEAIPLQSYDLFDLGVVDVDGDDELDVYTVNHSSLQSLLVNSGGSLTDDRFLGSGLEQTVGFPGIANQDIAPKPDVSGLYVYRFRNWLVLRAHRVEPTVPARLTLQVPWALKVRGDIAAVVDRQVSFNRSLLTVSLSGNQVIEILGQGNIVELPHQVRIDDDFPLSQVYVGTRFESPVGQEFVLNWRDRHAMVWSDVNDDGAIDVFMARGGIKGKIGTLTTPIHDELLLQQAARGFEDGAHAFGFGSKGACPARQATWVDIDGNGALDLHIVCGRGPDHFFPDQVWRRLDDGTFEEVAEEVGLSRASFINGVWFDVDADGDSDYLGYQNGKVVLYTNQHGTFSDQVVTAFEGEIRKFTLADVDNDGDLDVYALSKRESLLLINESGQLMVGDPADWGLPRKAETATWIDYDNDGLLEVHVVPDGLLKRRTKDGQFAPVGELVYQRPLQRIREGRCAWADFNADGAIDVVCGFGFYPSKILHHFETKILRKASSLRWRGAMYVNRLAGNGNHWLQVKLVGPPGNREAIGASVRLHTPSGVQARFVGHAEGAHFGQGSYRVYFGLGRVSQVDRLEVLWPDGSVQVVHDVVPDTLLTIGKP